MLHLIIYFNLNCVTQYYHMLLQHIHIHSNVVTNNTNSLKLRHQPHTFTHIMPQNSIFRYLLSPNTHSFTQIPSTAHIFTKMSLQSTCNHSSTITNNTYSLKWHTEHIHIPQIPSHSTHIHSSTATK